MNTNLSPYFEAINAGNPQHCKIYATALNGTKLTLTDDDIKQGGFQYDARTTSGDVLELGSTIASQLTLTLMGGGGIDTFPWYGATLLAQVGIETEGTIIYGNIGKFIVDEADCRYGVWTITALDNLVKFDKLLTTANWNTINNGTQTVDNLVRVASVACGVPVGTLDDLLNTTYILPTITPDNTTTWRNILQWCGEFAGVCFYCNGNGELCCKWYDVGSSPSDESIIIDHDRRYKSNVSADDVSLTGVIVKWTDGNESKQFAYPDITTDENDRYRIEIADNPLFNSTNRETYATAVGSRLDGFYYAPFDAQTVPFVYLNTMDGCYVEDNVYAADLPSTITHIAFTLNGSCVVEAVGKSVQAKQYQNGSAFTRQQAVIIDTVKDQLQQYTSQQTQAVDQLNTLMANAMGLQKYVDSNGRWYAYYSPRNDGIKNASIVYTLTDKGLAWAYGGYDEEHPEQTTWSYGITAEGSAILRQIFVEGIVVSQEDKPFSTTIEPSGWSLNNHTDTLMSASVATGEGILTLGRVVVKNDGYIKIGKARLYGTTNGMDIVIEE